MGGCGAEGWVNTILKNEDWFVWNGNCSFYSDERNGNSILFEFAVILMNQVWLGLPVVECNVLLDIAAHIILKG